MKYALPIFLQSANVNGRGVRVLTRDGRVFEADIVLVTVPLGVLKARCAT